MTDREKLSDAPPKHLLEAEPDEQYKLSLFVSGMTARSAQAVAAIRKVCEEHLPGRYELEVIDIYQQPELATADQVVAAPTLVKRLPEPLRRLIGDLSDTERVLVGLGLRPKSSEQLRKSE